VYKQDYELGILPLKLLELLGLIDLKHPKLLASTREKSLLIELQLSAYNLYRFMTARPSRWIRILVSVLYKFTFIWALSKCSDQLLKLLS